ncbi:hypothetical protein RRG08_052847 [Elysia crispata]|uniref:Uncharacterized protein n=1 Tax=Elysia crispata TaxID=231223 RepID=A0AAE1BD29_9GAST|nr:hypothetical protein RRG08_052847 [Elysia crispata]
MRAGIHCFCCGASAIEFPGEVVFPEQYVDLDLYKLICAVINLIYRVAIFDLFLHDEQDIHRTEWKLQEEPHNSYLTGRGFQTHCKLDCLWNFHSDYEKFNVPYVFQSRGRLGTNSSLCLLLSLGLK